MSEDRRFSLKPDQHMRWIYDPRFQDDPQAKDLRARRDAAIRSAPQWMLEEAHWGDINDYFRSRASKKVPN